METGTAQCVKQKTNTEQNTNSNHSNQEVCRCCYILLKTHFLQCSSSQKKRRYGCRTCSVRFKNKEELNDHKREKHPREWKQEQLKKIPKVLLEDDHDDNDDDDDDQQTGAFNPKTEQKHGMSKQLENNFVNQSTGNQNYFNGTGTSEAFRNDSVGTSELPRNQLTGTSEAFRNDSAGTIERPRNHLTGTSEGAVGNFFLENLVMNQEDETPHLSVSEETVPPEAESDIKVYECDICCSFLTNYDVYMKHVEKHREDETLGEEHDENSDDDDGSAKEQTEKTPVCKCVKCGETFKQEYLYDNHVITCGNKELRCCDCGKRFRNKTELVQHVKRQHVNYDCPYCGRKCGMKSRLREHLPVHTGVRAFQCKNCEQRFKRISNLNKHARICTGGKRLKCGECDASV